MKLFAWVLACGLGIALTGCQKGGVGSDITDNNKLNDSALLYARDIYLWYKNIPASFSAKGYSDPNAVMVAIRQFSIEPGFTNPVDRWSFAVTAQQWNNLSNGIGADFGLGVFFFAANDLRVSYVEKGSPAGKAGIQRSWRIKQINNNSNITTSNVDFVVQAVFKSSNGSFLFSRPSGSDTTINLAAASYMETPNILDTVYTTGATKTGYMVFNSFLGDTTRIRSEFQRIFNRFNSENVQDVIVDLRYNGGGYVMLQDELANYLVPTANNNDIAEDQRYNDKYSQYNTITRFKKKGPLNLSRLFVIVTQNTASASELLINSLKPYLNMQLIGPNTTHGKPVGFFGINVMDWVIFPVSFRTLNKNGEGNYFNGMPVSYQVMDGLDKGWGDVSENCLAAALRYINTGSYARLMAPESRTGLSADVTDGNAGLGRVRFKGAVTGIKTLH